MEDIMVTFNTLVDTLARIRAYCRETEYDADRDRCEHCALGDGPRDCAVMRLIDDGLSLMTPIDWRLDEWTRS